ncbi:MAG: hypothetical protein V9G19_15695 [Tetrasphaera sp.]
MTGRDPVEEFFAREKAMITREPADEERWQAIVAAGRRGRRSRWMTYAAGAAAAAAAVGVLGYAIGRAVPGTGQGDPAGRGSVTALSTPSSATSGTPSAVASSSAPATPNDRGTSAPPPASDTEPAPPPPGDTVMPATFKTMSMSQAGPSTIFALGEGVCTDRFCPVVARSEDNGRSWRQVATFTDGSYRQIRMADEQIGWVFGPDIKQTTDGGLTWHDYTAAGKGIVDLASNGADVAIVSTSGMCDGQRCEGELLTQVVPKELRAATVAPVVTKTAPVIGASVAFWKDRAYVSPQPVDGPGQPFSVGADGQATPLDIGCGDSAAAQVVVPGDGDTLFATCADGGAAGTAYYSIHRSHDEGATWEAVPGKPVALVNAGMVSFAAGDDEHLVAVSGGSADVHGSLLTSANGGRTWRNVVDPALPERGWRWVGAPGAKWFYLLPTEGEKAYWWAQDFGDTWSKVPMD